MLNPASAEMGTDPTNPEGTPTTVEKPKAEAGLFSQEDLERKVVSRLDRERRKYEAAIEKARLESVEAFRQEHGLSDDTLTSLGKQPDVAIEKIKGEAARASRELAKAAEERDRYKAMLSERLTMSAVVSAAAKDCNAPDALWKIVRDRVKVSEDMTHVVILGDDGQPNGQSVEEMVSSALEALPQLKRPSVSPGGGSRPGTAPASGHDLSTSEGRIALIKEGIAKGSF